MIRKQEGTFLSEADGLEISALCIMPEEKTEYRAVVQLVHGMSEHKERYIPFMEYLAEKGYITVIHDHRGHGKSVKNPDDLGYMYGGGAEAMLQDIGTVNKEIHRHFPDLPVILFGHSMGSFMARRYLMTYGEELTGAIICGTGYTPGAVLTAGKLCAGVISKVKGERHRSKFLQKLAFDSYNKRIADKRTANDWLTKNTEMVDAYNRDKYCTFLFTVNGYQTLFDVLGFIQKKENIEKIPKNLPVYMIAGEEDPVGNYGKGVEKVFEEYRKCGIRDLELKLYEDDRHEILNELDRENVYLDVKNWILKHI